MCISKGYIHRNKKLYIMYIKKSKQGIIDRKLQHTPLIANQLKVVDGSCFLKIFLILLTIFLFFLKCIEKKT